MPPALSNFQSLVGLAVPWSLVVFRVAGLFLMTPLLTSVMIPMRFKALLAVMLSAAAYPMLHVTVRDIPTDTFGVAGLIAGEILIGFSIGAIAAIPLVMLEMSGVFAGTSMGLGLSRVYSADTETDTDVLGQLLFFLGMSIFLAVGGLESLFSAILSSFDRIPPGSISAAQAPLDTFVAVLASGFEMGFRVSAPVVGIVLLLIVILGVLGKAIPQINTMSVGFTVKIMCGIAMLALGVYAIRQPISQAIDGSLLSVSGWITSFGAPGARGGA